MKLDNFLKDDRRWMALTLAVLAIGIFWTLASRAPVAANTGGAQPAGLKCQLLKKYIDLSSPWGWTCWL